MEVRRLGDLLKALQIILVNNHCLFSLDVENVFSLIVIVLFGTKIGGEGSVGELTKNELDKKNLY